MTTDWRERLQDKIRANPLASSGPPIDVVGAVEALDDAAVLRAGAMGAQIQFGGVSRSLAAPSSRSSELGTDDIPGGQVELSLKFRYFRSGSSGAGSKQIDETSEADFNDLP